MVNESVDDALRPCLARYLSDRLYYSSHAYLSAQFKQMTDLTPTARPLTKGASRYMSSDT